MSTYLENLKWIVSGKKETEPNKNIEIIKNNGVDKIYYINSSGSESELDLDYDEIVIKDSDSKSSSPN